ncbi:MAG: YARHG domain-containing protein, partial [Lachnospiraceae bacterium]|nr:YARHG domain-containing protein [Lachnospiraceae bacterium]
MKRFQVKAAAILYITVIGLGLAGCTDQTAAEETVTKEAFSTEETQQEEMQQEETEAFAEDGHDRVLKESALSWCTSYFKMGNPGYRLVVTPGGRWNRNQLNLEFIKEEDTGGGSVLHSLTFYYEENKRSQHYEDRDGTDDLTAESVPEYDVLLQKDGFVSLTGDSAAAGQYYPEKLLFKPEAFKRPLNASDLLGCTREELRILKNQFYAVYGRKFKSLELQEYFEKQPWYEGTIEGDRFDEAVFCPLEMSNLELLQKA